MSTKNRTRLRTTQAFKAEIGRWSNRVHAHPAQIRFQTMRRKWASCSPKRRLTFNRELLRQSRDFQEFVIVHELLHIKVPNHGQLIKSLLRAFLPQSFATARIAGAMPIRRSTHIKNTYLQ